MTFDWLKVVNIGLPAILSIIPGLPAVLVPLIVQAITDAEGMSKDGADKKAHVLREVTTAISILNASGTTVIDMAKVMPIVERAIDDGIQIANLVTKRR